jgi:hypothetical protein
MASKTAARGPAGTPVTAVVPASLDHDELMAMLGQAGMLPKQSEGNYRRMSLTNGTLVTDPGQPDEESWPPTKRGPTMIVRIVKPPIYYSAFFMAENEANGGINANRIGRPELNGRFAKKYDDPEEQAADDFSNLDAYEALANITGKRGSFKADIQLQIMPEDGEFKGDEPVYTLSLSTTSALDFRGSSKNPAGGVVQEKNFIVQLAEFAQAKAIEEGGDKTAIQTAVLNAMTALRLGGVVAEVYLILTSNEDKSNTWTVVAFKPIHVETGTDVPALTEGEVADDLTTNSDDIGF